jgi:hypothetical protein
MRSAGVYKAWVSWLDNAMELKRQAGVSYKVLLRWKSQRMAKMYEAWATSCLESKRLCRTAAKVIHQWRLGVIARAWAVWSEMGQAQARERCTGIKVVLRWANRQNLGKVAARMQLGGLCKSWAIWRNVATLGRIDRVCKRVFEHTRSMMLVGVGDTAILRSYNRRMAVSILFGWRLATKDAIAVCQRRMPFSRTSSYLVRKYERAVCARAISCWYYCCTARGSLRHAHFVVERVPFVSLSVFLILSMPPPPLSSCLPSFLCLFICMYTHTHTHRHTNKCHRDCKYLIAICVCFRFSATRGAVGVLSGCAGEELKISMPTCLGSQILCFTSESIITCQKKVKQIGNTSLNTCVE